MAEWYYTAAGQQQGPVAEDALRGLVAAGSVSANDLVWKEGMPQWTAVSLIPELLGAAPAAHPSAHGGAGTTPLGYGGYTQYPVRVDQGQGIEYGGFWIRVGAWVIDYLVLLIPSLIINAIFQAIMFSTTGPRGTPSPTQMGALAGIWMSSIALNWLYYALMESSSMQATVGKLACGLVVTNAEGGRITFGRATGRYFSKILSGLMIGIGYIMIGFDARKRGLHDQMAGTYVVKKSSLRAHGQI